MPSCLRGIPIIESHMKNEMLAFIGGGNMASAIIGGLVADRDARPDIIVVEPGDEQRARLTREFDVRTLATADASLRHASLVVWAVKPQVFAVAAGPCRGIVSNAVQLSVMAGIRSDVIARATGTERVARAMPNTPALIGQGIAGLYARQAVSADDRARIDTLLAPTGRTLWVGDECDLDAVTALSGSGPAYVFYVIEAMMEAAVAMGLSAEQGRQLAISTISGSAALAQASNDPPALLRERVTSKGGTTHAAITAMEASGVKPALVSAIRAAQHRAVELGDEFGSP